MLIDGGGAFGGFAGQEASFGIDPGEEAVSPYLWSRGFQKLGVVILTHAHQGHLGGLSAVLENFRVGKLWIGREVSSAALAKLEQLAGEREIPIEHELHGKSFDWDGVLGEFLWPETESQNIAAEARNDDSLVLRLQYGDKAILLPGDAERQAERGILASNKPETLRSDVLKIGHHGEKTPQLRSSSAPSIRGLESFPLEKPMLTAIQARNSWSGSKHPACMCCVRTAMALFMC